MPAGKSRQTRTLRRGRATALLVVSRAPSAADRDDVGGLSFHGRFPDSAFFDRVPVFVGRPVHGGYRVAAVFTHQVHDLGAVKRSTLAVRMPMPTTAQTNVEDPEEDVHDSPVSVARSQSCNLPDCTQRVNGRILRNTLAVRPMHSRPDGMPVCEKVCLSGSKSFLVLSSFTSNYRSVEISRQ